MPRTVTFNGVSHTFPDDATDQEIAAALGGDEPSTPSRGLGDRVADALPQVGGMVGSLTGGIGGAALGGAAGQGYGTLLKHAGEMPGAIADVARNAVSQPRATFNGFMQGAGQGAVDSGLSGAGQAALDAGGQVAGAGLKVLGKGVYAGGAWLLPKTLKQEFPRMAEAGYREGVALTRKGADKARGLIESGSTAVKDKLAMMQRAGAKPIAVREVTPALKPVQQTFKSRTELGLADETQGLAQRVKNMRVKNPQGIELTRAQDLKKEAQNLASTAYRAQDRGAVINSGEAMTNQAMAKGLREAIESRVPSVGPMNERIQEAIGLERGAEHATNTSHILTRLMAAGGAGGMAGGVMPALGAAAAAGTLSTAQGLTRAGLALKGAGNVAGHWLTPQALRAALIAELSGGE